MYTIAVYLYLGQGSNKISDKVKSLLEPGSSYYIGSYLSFWFSMFYLLSQIIENAKKNLLQKVLYTRFLIWGSQ